MAEQSDIVNQILGDAAGALDEPTPSQSQPQQSEDEGTPHQPQQQPLFPEPSAKEQENKPAEPEPAPEAEPPKEPEEGKDEPAPEAEGEGEEEPDLEELRRLEALEKKRKELEDAAKQSDDVPNIEEERKRAAENLAATYAEELRNALGDEADLVPDGLLKALPRVIAKAQLDAAIQVMQALQQALPQLVQQQLLNTQRELTFEEAFYARWPQLREHSDLVKRVARVYFQANPDVDPRTAIEEIGAVAAARARIPLVSNPAPAAPQAPAQHPAPVKPGATATSTLDDNPFSKMYQDFIEEDL